MHISGSEDNFKLFIALFLKLLMKNIGTLFVWLFVISLLTFHSFHIFPYFFSHIFPQLYPFSEQEPPRFFTAPAPSKPFRRLRLRIPAWNTREHMEHWCTRGAHGHVATNGTREHTEHGKSRDKETHGTHGNTWNTGAHGHKETHRTRKTHRSTQRTGTQSTGTRGTREHTEHGFSGPLYGYLLIGGSAVLRQETRRRTESRTCVQTNSVTLMHVVMLV